MQIGIYVTKRSLIREDDIIITFNDVIKVDIKRNLDFISFLLRETENQ